MTDPTTWAIIAGMVLMYGLGRSIGKAAGRDEGTSTVIIVNLDGETVGTVKIDGVLVIPNAGFIPRTSGDTPNT